MLNRSLICFAAVRILFLNNVRTHTHINTWHALINTIKFVPKIISRTPRRSRRLLEAVWDIRNVYKWLLIVRNTAYRNTFLAELCSSNCNKSYGMNYTNRMELYYNCQATYFSMQLSADSSTENTYSHDAKSVRRFSGQMQQLLWRR